MQLTAEVHSCYTHPASGHIYVTLKEEDCVLDAVCWKRTQVADQISAGTSMIFEGKIVIYPQRSKYQLIITDAHIDQVGIEQQIEQTKRKLEAEGLFEQCKKKAITKHAEAIGVITSESGAALFDMKYQFDMCVPAQVLLVHAAVQGANAIDEIIAAIDTLSATDVDVIILARGGGSAEDLLVFSDERLVRKVAACEKPILSAIGHEVDTTLCDLAADARVSTPTAAPSYVLPLKTHLEEWLRNIYVRITEYINNETAKASVPNISLEHLNTVCEMHAQYADHKIVSIYQHLMHCVSKFDLTFRLPAMRCDWIANIKQRATTIEEVLRREYDSIVKFGEIADVSSPQQVLKRGFCLIKSGNAYKTSAKDCEKDREYTAVFHDGEVELRKK